jgi:hypothetical protein
MKKLLLIITRNQKKSEYENFWNLSESDSQPFSIGELNLLILNGYSFSKNLREYKIENIIAALEKLADKDFSIGIIYHNTKQVEFENQLRKSMSDFKLTFIEPYTSTDKSFFEEEKPVGDFDRPLNKLYNAVKDKLQKDLFREGFEAVWNYKSGDDVLEAKLQLLFLLAKNKGNNATELWSDSNKIASLEKYSNDWKDYFKSKDLIALTNSLFEIKK